MEITNTPSNKNSKNTPWYMNWKIVTPIGVAIVVVLGLVIGLSVGLTVGKGGSSDLNSLHKARAHKVFEEDDNEIEDDINKEIDSIEGLNGSVNINTYTNLSDREFEHLINGDEFTSEEYFIKYTQEINNFKYEYENEQYSKVYKVGSGYHEYLYYTNEDGVIVSSSNYYINDVEFEYKGFGADNFNYERSLDKANFEISSVTGANGNWADSITLYFNGIESSVFDDSYGFYSTDFTSSGNSVIVTELKDNNIYNQSKLNSDDKVYSSAGSNIWAWTGSQNFDYRYFAA